MNDRAKIKGVCFIYFIVQKEQLVETDSYQQPLRDIPIQVDIVCCSHMLHCSHASYFTTNILNSLNPLNPHYINVLCFSLHVFFKIHTQLTVFDSVKLTKKWGLGNLMSDKGNKMCG